MLNRSSSSSSFASCFRSTTLPMDLDPSTTEPLPLPLPLPPPPPRTSGTANLSTCVYNTDLGVFVLTWCRNVIGRALHIDLRLDDHDEDVSFRLPVKPFLLWRRYGSKIFNLSNPTRKVEIFWDLTKVKFNSGPEPQSGFYVAVVIDGEMILLVGDSYNQAYSKTRARKPERTQVLILRREHVVGKKYYTTKARFGGKIRCISIDCRGCSGDEPSLFFCIDGKCVLQVKRLKWKFRGNERTEMDGVPIQVSWDVYNWLFDDANNGHAVFMFRFEKMDELEEGVVGLPQQQPHGFGMNGFEWKKIKKSLLKTRSSSSSSMSSASSGCSSSVMEWASTEETELQSPYGFSLLVYAWKS
ncbi:uncharacterized protein LOC122068824 [Macadamia integrifolia]|uniref:uncharacterized protein LOC122068824 n=1 Tax=Macadamia integrifolia TaxID=60698 RepID=UPI001C4FD4D2|nr:uncharacterized protein LOC122068824 [Macadamia integrifolia]